MAKKNSDPPSSETPAPDPATGAGELLAKIRETLSKVEPVKHPPPALRAAYSDALHQADLRRIEIDQRKAIVERDKQFTALRGRWSNWLIVWISVLLVFHITLTVTIGYGHMDFKQYQWFLPMVVLQNFLQIVGMGFIVVKFLYPGAGGPTSHSPPPKAT